VHHHSYFPRYYQRNYKPNDQNEQNYSSSHHENFAHPTAPPFPYGEGNYEQNYSSSHHENFAHPTAPPFPYGEGSLEQNYSSPHHENFAHSTAPPFPHGEGSLEYRLNYLSYQVQQLIEQNKQLLERLDRKAPEQSQTVTAPGGGGSIIVRM
jgi:hypothetical protein